MMSKHMKRCTTSSVIRAMRAETRIHCNTLMSMTKIQKTGCEVLRKMHVTGTLIHCWQECKVVQALGETFDISF
jgi:hypothetical protein